MVGRKKAAAMISPRRTKEAAPLLKERRRFLRHGKKMTIKNKKAVGLKFDLLELNYGKLLEMGFFSSPNTFWGVTKL